MVACAPFGIEYTFQGAIQLAASSGSGECNLRSLNFTDCWNEVGSMMIAAFESSAYRCSFLTGIRCGIMTGIDNQGTFAPTISNSNFYGNLNATYGVLYNRHLDMTVENCVFSGNHRDLGRADDGTLTVKGCVFSSSKLTDPSIKYGDNCHWNSMTMSRAICHVNTALCPAHPCATQTPIATVSGIFDNLHVMKGFVQLRRSDRLIPSAAPRSATVLQKVTCS
jgi:hypothetical protein